MRWEGVLAWRTERQHLARRAPAAAWLDVVSGICGLHAQVMSSAELSLRARVDDPPPLARSLWTDRTLVKTWAMRGTLHLLAAHELALYVGAQAALKPRTETPAWLRHHGLTAGRAQALLERVPAALRAGPLTREELAERAGEPKLLGGYGDLLKPVAFRGELVFAPSAGQYVRFALPEPFTPFDPAAATRELARRHMAAYGPATRADLARWFGHPSAAQAGRWQRALGDDAVEVDVEGRRGWLLAADAAAAEAAAPSGSVRLLPAFDPYVVATPRDETAALAPGQRDRVYRSGGWFSPVLLVDGVMAGVWRQEAGAVTIEPFAPVGAEIRAAAEAEAARLPGHRDVIWAV
jgi:Winged helix DNA-binding domain